MQINILALVVFGRKQEKLNQASRREDTGSLVQEQRQCDTGRWVCFRMTLALFG
jgi:hypothetical protein